MGDNAQAKQVAAGQNVTQTIIENYIAHVRLATRTDKMMRWRICDSYTKKLGGMDRAKELWRAALEIYEAIEDPNAERVRGWLNALERE